MELKLRIEKCSNVLYHNPIMYLPIHKYLLSGEIQQDGFDLPLHFEKHGLLRNTFWEQMVSVNKY